MDPILVGIGLTFAGLTGLLVAEFHGWRLGVWIAKPGAATGYLIVAVASGAFDTRYGVLILCGLTLSWLGDVLLIPQGRPNVFRAGILSFLLGHVAYAIAFAGLAQSAIASAGTALICGIVAWRVLLWLIPHVDADMKVPVYAYVGVISLMLILAAGCAVATSRPDIFAGALLFYLSDLAVARDRFVVESFWNGAWGLPCYFIAQLILALGVA
jgi:uncharacterized membrane protein YhhN